MQQFVNAVIAATLVAAALQAHAGPSEKSWSEAGSFEASAGRKIHTMTTLMKEYRIPYPVPPVPMPPIPMPPFPRPTVDAFQGLSQCAVVDAHFVLVRPLSLQEAVKTLGPCMAAVSARYGVAISASEGLIDVRDRAIRRMGILVVVGSIVPEDNSVLDDLTFALRKRHHIFLGHPAKLHYIGESRPEPRPGRSSLQSHLDTCILPMFLAPIRTASDFVEVYGHYCLRPVSSLAIANLLADRENASVVRVYSMAASPVIDAMNGMVQVPGDRGPVWFRIFAHRNYRTQP